MTLYHGSNQDIVEVDLLKGMSYKDFGRGFSDSRLRYCLPYGEEEGSIVNGGTYSD